MAAILLLVGFGVSGFQPSAPAASGDHLENSELRTLGPASPMGQTVCNSPTYVADSSLLTTLPNANGTLLSGGTISATFEVAVYSSTSGTTGGTISFPSVFVTFPLTQGTRQIDFSPGTVPIPSSGWASSASMNRTVSTSSNLAFSAGSNASLSTQKAAVMATRNYSSLSLEFRWSWTLTQPNRSTTSSGWSVPTSRDHAPSQLRSIFYPAPFVSFLNSSGSPDTIGANYTATIGGNVAGRYFLLEMEYPTSGKVVQAQGQTAPWNVTTFPVFIPVLGYTRALSPGNYLVHIHDACGALLYNKVIRAVFAPNVTLKFAVSPAGCAVDFNGTNRYNGSSVTVVPSVTPYSLSVGCIGHTFSSWSGSGGIHVQNGHSLLISAGGTFTTVYR